MKAHLTLGSASDEARQRNARLARSGAHCVDEIIVEGNRDLPSRHTITIPEYGHSAPWLSTGNGLFGLKYNAVCAPLLLWGRRPVAGCRGGAPSGRRQRSAARTVGCAAAAGTGSGRADAGSGAARIPAVACAGVRSPADAAKTAGPGTISAAANGWIAAAALTWHECDSIGTAGIPLAAGARARCGRHS